MKKIYLLNIVFLLILTGCSYNNINYFGDDSVTESKYYFGENEEQDAKITAAYANTTDYLLTDFNVKVVSSRKSQNVNSYDFIETSISMINNTSDTINTGSNEISGISFGSLSKDGVSIVEYARQFVGNPYVYGGVSLTKGADCSGFVQSVYKHFGYMLPRTAEAQYRACKNGLQGCKMINKNELRAGDLIFYRKRSVKEQHHVAIYSGAKTRVHAWSTKYGIVENTFQSSIAGEEITYGRVITDKGVE
mgnify:CR=1 FL=1